MMITLSPATSRKYVVAGLGMLVGPAGVNPHAEEESLQLGPVVVRVGVVAGGKAQGFGGQARRGFS